MNEEEGAALALLARMRFACGDNGKRMQDELEEYLRELKRDADRYRWLVDSGNDTYAMFVEAESKADLDALIDAAMKGANT